MKKLIILLSVLSLSGCFYQKTSKIDIQKAIYFCGSVDNIWDVSVYFSGDEVITCTDYTKEVGVNITL